MGLIKTALKTAVAVKTAHVVHDRIERRKQEQWVAQGHPPETFPASTDPVGGLMTAGAGLIGGAIPAQAPPPVPTLDVASQLRELANLRAEGLLTDAEFETQKQRVLSM